MNKKGSHGKEIKNPEKKRVSKKTKKEGKKSKTKFSKKHPRIALMLKILLVIILLLAVIGVGIVVGLLYGPWGQDFEITKEELTISSSNSVILDKDGNRKAELSGDTNRKIVRYDQVPDNLKNAYIAIEDERFESHNGIDLKRTAGAVVTYAKNTVLKLVGKDTGNSSFGGSTITQQVVKNLTGDKDRDGFAGILRKVKEWAKAYQIERMISKNQILELYLNLIYIGGNRENLGVGVGAEYYFNKPVSDLSLEECAFLAGINNSPNAYDPYSSEKPYSENGEKRSKVNDRCKTVLSKMLELGKINQEDYDNAVQKIDEGLHFEKSQAISGNIYSFHTDATISQVINDFMEQKGWSREYATTYVYGGGLTIYSTQDSNVQSKMEEVMKNPEAHGIDVHKDKNGVYAQAGMVIIDNSTGYVAGVVGGFWEKTESRGLNRATQSPRQTGSSIKPLTSLVPGIEEGVITPATRYYDNATKFGNWEPQDAGSFHGEISIRQAITTSQNIPFAKVVAELTPAKSMEYLKKMGVTTLDDERDNNLASISIGGFTNGISPLEMAGAYATIENDGVYREPLFYTKITDNKGDVVLEPEQKTEYVISPQAAYVIKNLLISVGTGEGATASYCKISGIDTALKTGSSNDYYDRWLCGFTNYYTGAVWYGFDVNNKVRLSGTNRAGKVWEKVMKSVHQGLEPSTFARPDGVSTVTVCRASGKKATSLCTDTYSEVFMSNHIPGDCDAHTNSAKICKDTGLLANEFCPNVETKYFSYTIEKERLKLWSTSGVGKSEPPTNICMEHNSSNSGTPVSDTPTITLNGSEKMTLKIGEEYVELGAKAQDDTDGDLTNKISISGTVNTGKKGTYKVTYTVKNSKGKEATKTRTITVTDGSSSGNTNSSSSGGNSTSSGNTTNTATSGNTAGEE